MPLVHYEVRIVGSLGPAARDAFAEFGITTEPAVTVLSGQLDQAALHGLINRAQSFGFEIIDVKRIASDAAPDRSTPAS
jgi:hypothetical protein